MRATAGSRLPTNADRLVEMAVIGEVAPPSFARSPYRPNTAGEATVMVGMGGVVLNVRVGDDAYHWAGDHVEPAVSIHNLQVGPDHALHYLTCVGNEAVVVSGDAAGARGVVTGEHARVLVDFEPEVLERLAIGDRIQIRAVGRGLQILPHPDIILKKVSPRLLDAIVEAWDDEGIQVPVTAEIPPHLMGSGMELNPDFVDQDMMTRDWRAVEAHGLDRLRLGDLVAVRDADHRWHRGTRPGAVTLGLVIHGDSVFTGHGPGILDLMSCDRPKIRFRRDPNANIARLLGIRRDLDA